MTTIKELYEWAVKHNVENLIYINILMGFRKKGNL